MAQILVTGRFRNGRLATPDEFQLIVLHEMGHALGLGGHSPDPGDVMYAFLDLEGVVPAAAEGLEAAPQAPTARDRTTLRKLYERPAGARMAGARRAD